MFGRDIGHSGPLAGPEGPGRKYFLTRLPSHVHDSILGTATILELRRTRGRLSPKYSFADAAMIQIPARMNCFVKESNLYPIIA